MAFRATESAGQFRRLLSMALLSGALAGLVLFVYQYFVIVPRIVVAEAYEACADEATHSAHDHERTEWKPAEGWERTFFTAASTILAGIGFAAVFLATISLAGAELNWSRGLLWGLAGFACFVIAPALGLPPEPPGVPVADVRLRQLWWVGTVCATATGLFLVFSRGRKGFLRVLGFACFAAPHVIGAPVATGPEVVPAWLVREFAIASVVGNGIFWLTLGLLVGCLFKPDRGSLLARHTSLSSTAQLFQG
jgi:cobalt transporter subunit CbtA